MDDIDNEYSNSGEPVQWLSPAPIKCDCCSASIKGEFVDGKTKIGLWACMCMNCYLLGPGIAKLGLGLGQRYVLQADGVWLKMEG